FMATEVVMPQMGESIAEGTIVRWIKKVGDKIDRDEPLFEISTDKVDAEIPSPAAGVIAEIRVKEGETVPINTVVALIGGGGEAKAAPEADAQTPPAPAAKPVEPPRPTPQADGSTTTHAGREAQEGQERRERQETQGRQEKSLSTEDALHQRSSPLVRKIAKEHNVDISSIHGTGIAGRVTKDDILEFIGQGGQGGQGAQGGQDRRERQEGRERQEEPAPAPVKPATGDRVEK